MPEYEKIITIVTTGIIIFTIIWKFIGNLLNRIVSKFVDRTEEAIRGFNQCRAEDVTWKALMDQRVSNIEDEIKGIGRREKRR